MNDILAWIMSLVAAVLPGLATPGPQTWNGYVEEDYLYAAPASAGTIEMIAVSEGELVRRGDVLFVLDQSQQLASLQAAQAQADTARANLANLQTGQRPEEIGVMEAQLRKAAADLTLAQSNLRRTEDLFKVGNAPQAQFDTATSTVKSAQAAVDILQAQIEVARLPAREALRQAAAGQLQAAEAQVEAAQSGLDLRTVTAPKDARVERLFFQPGEVAGAGVPVVSLSGAEAFKVNFYVNEGDRPQFALGQQVGISCDGCAPGLTATITRFASAPQFTPPIIYSRDERSRLVFLTEATMTQQTSVIPGQPVTIGLSR